MSQAGPKSEFQFRDFPFGTHIYRDPHLPMDQLRADLPVLKRLGFNMIKIQETWAYDERVEGEVDLDKLAGLVSAARSEGLGVYFGLTMESAPAWFWRKHPDAFMVYGDGSLHRDPVASVLPGDGKPGPCWHHPGARADAERFIRAVGSAIGRFDNIRVWNVWQEIGYLPMVRHGQLPPCYCDHSLTAYRSWLRQRYADLASLNDRWKTAFGAWEEVEPPRNVPMNPATIDWRYYMDAVHLSDVLSWKTAALHESDPMRREVFAHVSHAKHGTTREWLFARATDFTGASCYPKAFPLHRWDRAGQEADPTLLGINRRHGALWQKIFFNFDYIRSASKDGAFWVAELQGGPLANALELGRVPDAAEIRLWLLGLLATGATGISFWNHRPEICWFEIDGFGLLDFTGDTSERAAEAGRIGKAIQAEAELFTTPRAKAPIGLLVNEELYRLLDAPTSVAGRSLLGWAHVEHLDFTMLGIYRALLDAGYEVDFVDSSRTELLGAYQLLIAPLPMAISDEVIDGLVGFVEGGGTLLAEASVGRMDSNGLGRPGGMDRRLQALFGARPLHLHTIRSAPGATHGGPSFIDGLPHEPMKGQGDFAGQTITPAYFLQTLELTDGTAAFRFGEAVAGSYRRHGKGEAILAGTLLGHGVLGVGGSGNGAWIAAVAERAGVAADRAGALIRRRRELDGKAAWFLFNLTDQTISEHVDIEGFARVRDLLGDRVERSGDAITVTLPPLAGMCLILEN